LAFLGRRPAGYVNVDPEFEQRVQGNESRKNNVKCKWSEASGEAPWCLVGAWAQPHNDGPINSLYHRQTTERSREASRLLNSLNNILL